MNSEAVEAAASFPKKTSEQKSGVCFLSRVPPGMTLAQLRHLLSDQGVGRIFLNPAPNSKPSKPIYKNGYLEFPSAARAEEVADKFNGTLIGGKKSSRFHDDIWCLKFEKGKVWGDLVGQREAKKKMVEHRVRAEIGQVRRMHDFVVGQQLKHKGWRHHSKEQEASGAQLDPKKFKKNIFKPKKPLQADEPNAKASE